MAWDNGEINPRAQKIFDAPEEEQGKMVNELCMEYDESIRKRDWEIEKLKERNEILEKTFKDILKAPAIKEYINNVREKQRADDAELERIARGYERENKWMQEHGGW